MSANGVRISELPLGTPSVDAVFPFSEGGTTYKGLLSALQAVINPVNFFHTFTAGELAAKQLTLPVPIRTGLLVDVVAGGPQQPGVDFTAVGNLVTWAGMGWDSMPFAPGDKVRFYYWP